VDYKRVNIYVATEAMKVCMQHFWYISETLVGLAFFDDEGRRHFHGWHKEALFSTLFKPYSIGGTITSSRLPDWKCQFYCCCWFWDKASLCQIPAVIQVKHVEYITETCLSTAVQSSTSVKVAVTESLFMESILVDIVVAEKSIHWKHVFLVFS